MCVVLYKIEILKFCVLMLLFFLKRLVNMSIRRDFANMEELSSYQQELLPILLDSFEVQKLASRNCQTILKSIENLLVNLYVQFNPHVLISLQVH